MMQIWSILPYFYVGRDGICPPGLKRGSALSMLALRQKFFTIVVVGGNIGHLRFTRLRGTVFYLIEDVRYKLHG